MAHKTMGLGLAGSVAAIALMAFTAPAGAQNMGALKAQIDALQKKVDAMAKKAPADKFIHRGKKNFELEVSGQVNRTVRYANDGDHDQVQHVDNNNSGSRVRWVGKGRLNEDITAGTVIEMNITTAQGTQMSLQENANGGSLSSTGVNLRKQDIFFDSKRMGRLWVGRGDPASNGTSEYDLSGLGVTRLSGTIQLIMGGVKFQNNGVVSSTGVAQAWSAFDGNSRDDRIRYDTPKFAGFQIGVTHMDGDDFDVAAKFNGKLGGTKVKAGAAYNNRGTSTSAKNQINGSGSVLLPMGLSATISGGLEDREASGQDDRWDIFGRIG